jgi:undecaprenyl-phosphate 4-deoxy-4-formamido-L-arabinose transferase
VEDSATTKTGVSVVIPVYNSEEILPALLERLAAVLPQAAASYEVILVNDGSRDNSWTRIQELAARYSFVRGFELMRNFGQHNALLAGVRAAHFDVVVTMDDDLQHPPEEIGKLLTALTADKDVVYGVPAVMPHSHGRNLASRLTKLVLQKAMGAEIASRVDAFRAFRTQLREAFANFMGAYISLDVLLTWGTSRFGMVTVDHHPRRVGESNYNFRKLMTHTLNMMTGFSPLPLQLASLLGFGTTAFGVLVLTYVLIRAFVQKGAPPGFPLLVSIISIFSGAQLVALGIIGEYLARVHARSLDRPPYVVRRRTS